VEKLFDFSAFVTMLEGFFGMVIGFSEGVFGIPHCIVDYIQCLGHSSNAFLDVELSAKDANLPSVTALDLQISFDRFKQFKCKTMPPGNCSIDFSAGLEFFSTAGLAGLSGH
jgi:hypothetical protein